MASHACVPLKPGYATYQPHSSEDGDPIHRLEAEVEEAGHHNRQVEDVPAITKIFCSRGRFFNFNSKLKNKF